MAIHSQKRGKIRLEKATAEEIFATLKISASQIEWANKALAALAPAPSRRVRQGKATPVQKKRAKR